MEGFIKTEKSEEDDQLEAARIEFYLFEKEEYFINPIEISTKLERNFTKPFQ